MADDTLPFASDPVPQLSPAEKLLMLAYTMGPSPNPDRRSLVQIMADDAMSRATSIGALMPGWHRNISSNEAGTLLLTPDRSSSMILPRTALRASDGVSVRDSSFSP